MAKAQHHPGNPGAPVSQDASCQAIEAPLRVRPREQITEASARLTPALSVGRWLQRAASSKN